MSDYPNHNPNLHRADGVSGRGILIALGVVVLVVAILAALGSGSGGGEAVLPAAEDTTAPAASTAQPVSE